MALLQNALLILQCEIILRSRMSGPGEQILFCGDGAANLAAEARNHGAPLAHLWACHKDCCSLEF